MRRSPPPRAASSAPRPRAHAPRGAARAARRQPAADRPSRGRTTGRRARSPRRRLRAGAASRQSRRPRCGWVTTLGARRAVAQGVEHREPLRGIVAYRVVPATARRAARRARGSGRRNVGVAGPIRASMSCVVGSRIPGSLEGQNPWGSLCVSASLRRPGCRRSPRATVRKRLIRDRAVSTVLVLVGLGARDQLGGLCSRRARSPRRRPSSAPLSRHRLRCGTAPPRSRPRRGRPAAAPLRACERHRARRQLAAVVMPLEHLAGRRQRPEQHVLDTGGRQLDRQPAELGLREPRRAGAERLAEAQLRAEADCKHRDVALDRLGKRRRTSASHAEPRVLVRVHRAAVGHDRIDVSASAGRGSPACACQCSIVQALARAGVRSVPPSELGS